VVFKIEQTASDVVPKLGLGRRPELTEAHDVLPAKSAFPPGHGKDGVIEST
jgi:hypothetical protein